MEPHPRSAAPYRHLALVPRPSSTKDSGRPSGGSPGIRLAIGVSGAILVALIFSYLSLLARGKIHIEHSDLLVYYGVAHLVAGGHGSAIYDSSILRHTEAGLFNSPLHVRAQAAFLYPPYVALLLAPLSLLAFSTAYAVWILASSVLLAVVLWLLSQYLQPARQGVVLWWLGSLAFLPTFVAVIQGQVSILLLVLFTVSFLALSGGREEMAGVALGLALIKPPYLIPVLLVLVLQRRWRSLGALGVTASLLVLLPVPVLGWHANFEYIHTLRVASTWHTTGGGFAPASNLNLAGFFQLLFPRPLSTVLQLAASACVLALVARTAVVRKGIELPFAIAVTAGLLINPHVLVHDLCILLVPVAVAVRHASQGPKGLGALLAAGFLAVLAGAGLVSLIPIQLAVPAMGGVLVWLFLAAILPSSHFSGLQSLKISFFLPIHPERGRRYTSR